MTLQDVAIVALIIIVVYQQMVIRRYAALEDRTLKVAAEAVEGWRKSKEALETVQTMLDDVSRTLVP